MKVSFLEILEISFLIFKPIPVNFGIIVVLSLSLSLSVSVSFSPSIFPFCRMFEPRQFGDSRVDWIKDQTSFRLVS
jgi:hypothetical protein